MSFKAFTLPAFAKINWTLRVLGRRADGYHELHTIFQTVTLSDRLTFTPSDDSDITFDCDAPDVPHDESNLVVRAARALRERYRVTRGAAISLEKRIPSAAGLGGGSSDAAVALLGLARLWRLEPQQRELEELGADLGADVPFFFTGGTALGTGLGTEIEPLADAPATPLLIIKPPVQVSTAEAYKALNAPALTKVGGDIILSSSRPHTQIPDSLPDNLRNDFEPVIYGLHSEILRAAEALKQAGARAALLAGSGASVFGVFDDLESRVRAAQALRAETAWRLYECETLSRASYLEELGACARPLRRTHPGV
ncbi:MAG: 4-(cytidine 5'-diphospho)-2-C-methyl-D-erythritol kinase [Acidobacteria bacterium]|nr:4-(cytidine 5'-diphospho)-2-C-methyl-D-erythritol kinase [Acidobacteriota bacterium]